MGSLGEDISSQLHMMQRAYLKLREAESTHSLLELVKLHDDEGGFDFKNEFWDAFQEKNNHPIHAYAWYTFALEGATKLSKGDGKIENLVYNHEIEALKKYSSYQAQNPQKA